MMAPIHPVAISPHRDERKATAVVNNSPITTTTTTFEDDSLSITGYAVPVNSTIGNSLLSNCVPMKSPNHQRRRNSTTAVCSFSDDILLLPMYPPLSPKTHPSQTTPRRRRQQPAPFSDQQQLKSASPLRTANKVAAQCLIPTRIQRKGDASYTYNVHATKPTSVLRHSQSLPTCGKKILSFAAKDSIREIATVSDLTPDEVADTWWSAREYTAIRQDYEAVVYLMEQEVNRCGRSVCSLSQHLCKANVEHETLDDAYCTRGLHQRTEQGAWRLYERQRNARNAVLEAQEKYVCKPNRGSTGNTCSSNNITPPVDLVVEIAKAYWVETMSMRDEALRTAADDAAEIVSYLYGTTTPQRRPRKSFCTTTTTTSTGRDLVLGEVDPNDLACVCSPAPQAKFHDSMISLQTRRRKVTQPNAENVPTAVHHSPDLLEAMMQPDDIPDQGGVKDTINSLAHTKPSTVVCKVHFSEVIGTIKSRKVSDPEKDRKRRWYNSTEIAQIRSEANVVVSHMEQQSTHSPGLVESESGSNWIEAELEESPRGLEKTTAIGAALLRERRRAAWTAVCDFSRAHSVNDDDHQQEQQLALVYGQATMDACKEAIKVGKQDTKEAKKHRLRRRSTQSTKTTNLLLKSSAFSSLGETTETRKDQSKASHDDVRRTSYNDAGKVTSCLSTSLGMKRDYINHVEPIKGSLRHKTGATAKPKFSVPSLVDFPTKTPANDVTVSPSIFVRPCRHIATSTLSPSRILM